MEDVKITKKQFKAIKRFVWNRIRIVPTGERMTDAAGLGSIVVSYDASRISKELVPCLPERTGNRTHGSYRMALTQISSFIYGHDSLDDLEWFRKDPYIEESLDGKVAAPNTMGDFLRDFEPVHIDRMNNYFTRQSKTYRRYFQKALEEQ